MKATIFLKQLDKIDSRPNYTALQKVKELVQLFSILLEEATDVEQIHFTTIFSRLSFVTAKYAIPSQYVYHLHQFRRISASISDVDNITDLYALARYCTEVLIHYTMDVGGSFATSVHLPDIYAIRRKPDYKFAPILRGLLYKDEADFIFIDDIFPEIEYKISFEDARRDELFYKQLNNTASYIDFPVGLHLLDVNIEVDKQILHPTALVYYPNFLVDVTAVSECFKPKGDTPQSYVLRKFLPVEKSPALLLGNVANYFLDCLLANPDISYNTCMQKVFMLDPLAYSMYDDDKVKQIIEKAKQHFRNIHNVVNVQFPKQDIELSETYTEPTFLSRDYGLQGRLDVLRVSNDKKKNDIIELKSGKAYRANVYGLGVNHYTQTLLYDLIIKSCFSNKIKPTNYILYSGEKEKHLRFAPAIKSQQMDAIRMRNNLLVVERILQHLDDDHYYLAFRNLLNPNNPKLDGFVKRDLSFFHEKLSALSELEIQYFRTFAKFIATEHMLAKVGEHGVDKTNGMATLWLDNIEEKRENFTILSHLSIAENNSASEDANILFVKTEWTNNLSKFRKGDITVLYPYNEGNNSPLSNQIFKCTVLEINETQIRLRLRNKQTNQQIFTQNKFWNIEPDLLDSGFMSMYRNLFAFISADSNYRNKILTLQQPASSISRQEYTPHGLTDQQADLFAKMISAQDYFLLWGPPGTGKTSLMIRELVRYYHQKNDKPILLLSYTNRAVDEICAAVEAISQESKDDYIRIGSRYSTNEKYVDRLLVAQSAHKNSRSELIALLKQKNIIVSTVSSILGKQEIFLLKKFDTIIVDEASQILEPMLIGILQKTKKFILIGDHKQLPAVVVQGKVDSEIQFEELSSSLGLHYTNASLFERLILQCQRKKWVDNYGLLNFQGRMHEKLVAFPSEQFYNNELKPLPFLERLFEDQQDDRLSGMMKRLWENRVIFIDTPIDEELTHKTNVYEAKLVAYLLGMYSEIYKNLDKRMDKNTLGVITPYRAQIATILQSMSKASISRNDYSVDTVERYQGGARNHIIISMCVNRTFQLRSVSSISSEGVDRKFNVAITRAKDNLIIIGNKSALDNNPVYKEWIDQAYGMSYEELDLDQ